MWNGGGGEQNVYAVEKVFVIYSTFGPSSVTTHRLPNQTGTEIPLKPAEHFPVRRLFKDTEEHFDCVIYV